VTGLSGGKPVLLRSFDIRNYRCFRELNVPELRQVNLIAGKNNTGKTALMEALFLHLGPQNPQLSLVVSALRGIEQFSPNPTELWGWLFFARDTKQPIELISVGPDDTRRSLRLRLAPPERSLETPPSSGWVLSTEGDGLLDKVTVTTALGARELILEYEDSTGQNGVARAAITREGNKPAIAFYNSSLEPFPLCTFLGTRSPQTTIQDADRFSRLVEEGREGELVETLKALDTRLRRLLVLVTAGQSMIHGDVGFRAPVPVPLMGDGFGHLLSILLAIASVPGGMLLIDEIENGLHYSVLADMWRAIGAAARGSETQIMATTHSWECIQAARLAFEGSGEAEAFQLLRLDRTDADTRVVRYDREMIETAAETGLEVR
jgi:hypothetical protein